MTTDPSDRDWVLVLARSEQVRGPFVEKLHACCQSILGIQVEVDVMSASAAGADHPPELVFVEAGDVNETRQVFESLRADRCLQRAPRILLLPHVYTHEQDYLLLSRLHDRLLRIPCQIEILRDCLVDMRPDLFHDRRCSGPSSTSGSVAPPDRGFESGLLFATYLSDEDLESELISELDDALGHPPRLKLEPEAMLLEEGAELDAVYLVEEGQIQLYRTVGGREVTSHVHSTGGIIGILGLAQRRRAFFNCRALTPLTVVPIKLEQLDQAFMRNPNMAMLFASVIVRSLCRRNRRAAELQLEVQDLYTNLRRERDQLNEALEELERAQARLIHTEKLATLGQMTAGIAHELNNPISAIQRSTEFLRTDLQQLLEPLPTARTGLEFLNRALSYQPLPSREARRIRKEFEGQSGLSSDLARRLVDLGITQLEQLKQWCGTGVSEPEDDQVLEWEAYFQVGNNLRNLANCAERIGEIIQNLKSYSRADSNELVAVSLNNGLEETLLLLKPVLKKIDVTCDFEEIPAVWCRPGEINQVWTNLITNAADAMNGIGSLHIATTASSQDHVRVRIEDTGPGIPTELLERVFELNFTTKHGGASFGLGIGLNICKQVIESYGGTIHFESEPGRTVAEVCLPLKPSCDLPASHVEEGCDE